MEDEPDEYHSGSTGADSNTVIQDITIAIFMGASLDRQYANIRVGNANRKMVEYFSKPIA